MSPPKKGRLANLRLASCRSPLYDGRFASVPLCLYSGWFSHLSTREKKLALAVPGSEALRQPPRGRNAVLSFANR